MATSGSSGRRARLRLRTIAKGWPCYYEDSPVHPDEVLLRTIPNVPGYFTEEMGGWKVNLDTFKPRKSDADGLSFFREDFITRQKLAYKNTHGAGVLIARITVQQLHQLGLTAKPCPEAGQPPGHTVVPELGFVERHLQSKEEKRRLKDIQQRLAQFATANGVYNPPRLSAAVAARRQG